MESRSSDKAGPRNRLLALLEDDARQRLMDVAERTPLRLKQILFDANAPIEHVYFVEDGVVSLVAGTGDGVVVETATVGNEGVVGLPLFLGADRTSAQALAQIAGTAYRVPADAFREELRRDEGLVQLLGRYTQAFIAQTAQTSACNRLHTMRQRCARWLLECHDRVEGDTFILTQEFLSKLLGVRRATVSEVASGLQRDGVIQYEYGHITVRDRSALERETCECYAIIKREYERLIEAPVPVA